MIIRATKQYAKSITNDARNNIVNTSKTQVWKNRL
jgi:hypothetical protein